MRTIINDPQANWREGVVKNAREMLTEEIFEKFGEHEPDFMETIDCCAVCIVKILEDLLSKGAGNET